MMAQAEAEVSQEDMVLRAADAFALCLVSYGEGDRATALDWAAEAVQFDPAKPLYAHAHRYLQHQQTRSEDAGVYDSPQAFTAFINGGSNVPLYEAVSAALRAEYAAAAGPLRLLDIGVGSGRALLPALHERVAHVDLVEPSPLLEECIEKIAQHSVGVKAHPVKIEEFMQQSFDADAGRRWDVAQSSFALQSLPASERAVVLRWIRQHAHRLLLVEFDVGAAFERSRYDPARVQFVSDALSLGIDDYATSADIELVSQGFLMPVMFGYFDKTKARTNYEQPLTAWLDELRAAGFTSLEHRVVCPYWWSPVFMIVAS
eukprot:TRINITY_DN18324_c0_g1_i1.p1 TRINITY_DN18324_c0_g1~~TRINITY_DN18324_c0_g1_i1.p1  ORF type:complete len:317 (+),score=94.96 TRINITY_DN18324_c0_g1_i1:92-1042(+)